MKSDITGIVFDSSPIGIAIVNSGFQLVEVNEALCRILMYKKEELQNKTFIEITYPDDINKDAALASQLFNNEIPYYSIEKRFIRRDGEIIWARVSASKAYSKIANETFAIGYLEEITGQKKAEMELKDSESLFRSLFEYAPDAVYIHDLNGNFIEGNKAAEELIGYSKEEVIGKNFLELDLILPEYLGTIQELLQNVNLGKGFGPAEVVLKRRDGKLVAIETRLIPLKIKNEIVALGIARDITERKESLKKIKEQKEELKAIVNASPLPIISIDLNNIVQLWNPAAEKIFGWSESEISGKKYPLIPEELFEEHLNFKTKLLSKNFITEKEVIRQKKDKSKLEVILNSSVLRNAEGEVTGFMTVYTDVTDKKIAEKKSLTMFNTMAQGVVYQDAKGRIVNANPSAERILGVSLKEMKGRSANHKLWKSIRQDGSEFPGHLHPASIALKTGKEVFNTVVGVFNPEMKEYRWLTVHSVPLFKPGENKPYQVYSTFEDFTELREILNALKQAEQKNNSILNAMPDLIFVLSKSGVILNYKANNPDELFIPSEKFINRNIKDVLPSKISALALKKIEEAWKSGAIQTFEYSLVIKGKYVYSEARVAVAGEDEIMIMIRDITDKVKTRTELELYKNHLERLVQIRTNELEILNKQLKIEIKKKETAERSALKSLEKEKELNELKSRFVSMASHEFRTPLTSIKIFADLLKIRGKDINPQKYITYVDKIHKSVDHMTLLVEDVLTVSRTETGKLKFKPCKTNLYELCTQIIEENKIHLTGNHKLHFNYNITRNEVIIDEKIIRQVLSNLLSNAIKYSPNGGNIHFAIDFNGSRLIFDIKDEGLGISPEEKENVFESFFRGKNIGNIPGTGLGLSIVKKLVEIHDGSITFNSEIGRGTNFLISIPETNKVYYEENISC